MTDRPTWQYDEFKHAGLDYADPDVAGTYDAKHRRFRDYQGGADAIVGALGLTRQDSVIDMGCGTGAFCLYAAKNCGAIHAVDVSPAMLDHARRQAHEREIRNVEFHHGGFLTYKHCGPLADAMVSLAVLHHLPDLWKGVALWRAAQMLRLGGRFYLFDVVFRFELSQHAVCFDQFVDRMRAAGGEEMAREAAQHVRDEFSTWDWVLESLLDRAGFRIDERREDGPTRMAYLCTRVR